MGITSELARKIFKSGLEYSEKYGQDQVTFFTEQALQEFNSVLFAKFIEQSYAKLKNKFDDVVGKGASSDFDREMIGDICAFQVADNIKAIAFKRQDKDSHLLLAWQPQARGRMDATIFRLYAWKERFPLELKEELEASLTAPGNDAQKLREIYEAYSHYTFADFMTHGLVNYPSLPSLLRELEKEGVEKTRGICFGNTFVFDSEDEVKIHARKGNFGWKNDTDAIMLIKEIIAPEISNADLFDTYSDLDSELSSVNVNEMRQSLAALNIEQKMGVFEDQIRKMFEAAIDLELSNEISFAYNDTDIRLNMFKDGGKAFYFHNNQDLFEQKAFALVFEEREGKFASVDFHLFQSWYGGMDEDEEDWGAEEDQFERFANKTYDLEDSDLTVGQDEFLEQVKAGFRPGLMGSYNFLTGEFSAGPYFEKSALLYSLSNLIEYDYKAICRVADEDGELRSCQIEQRPVSSTSYDDVVSYQLDDWLEQIQERSVPVGP